MKRFLSAMVGCCVLLASCKVGPDYKPEKMPISRQFASAKYQDPTKEQLDATARELKTWWARFNDPVLNALIARAVAGNYDLQAATQHIMAAQAYKMQVQAQWYPHLSVNAGGGNTRYSTAIDNWPLRPFHRDGPGRYNTEHTGPGKYADAAIMTWGATGGWILDIFGQIAREVESQQHMVQATIAQRRAVLLGILSGVASDYIALRTIQERLGVVENSIRTAHQSTDMAQRMFANGVGNSLSVSQALAEEHSERARLPVLLAQQQHMIHAIAILMGEMPGTLEPALERRQKMPHQPAFPAALPSTVLENRPDIQEAQQVYAASMARIGMAVADLYPHFSVPITFDPNASAFSEMFTLYGMAWNFLLMASVPVLDGGRITSEILQARAAAEGSRLGYRQTVLDAFGQVEDTMTDWQQDNVQVQERLAAANQATLARDQAQELYAAGLTPFLDVLNTQQNALSAQESAVITRGARLHDAVALYVAMGEGWQGYRGQTELPIQRNGGPSIIERAFMR
ncbi:efflux transporter outer membrane subunit [Formicincola oecophyllae]|uniref:Efflux transporter outer membrane subunit n=1 Tax=Formicincola oecophyllae TaxID=2558361 RepID=A0A4Y6UB41_9PROT|nr:efflux transporter outer membrane subunit [Formicincola oecophyllae]QDH13677.1 efflux transporter outer membrane subunit [Formicincola oecophyllae]